MTSLLPPNATPQEIALDGATARVGDVPLEIKKLWDADTCPANLLPWLAWALSVDEWQADWTEAQQRATVAASYQLHAHKGTPSAIRTALAALGYDNIGIIELRPRYYDGAQTYGGTITHGADSAWPQFDVILNIGYVPDAAMVQRIRASIERYKNARSQLRNLTFMNLLYDNTVTYDGTYQHNGGVL